MPANMNIDISRRNPTPRPLSDDERAILEEYIDSIHYSARYVRSAVSPLRRIDRYFAQGEGQCDPNQ